MTAKTKSLLSPFLSGILILFLQFNSQLSAAGSSDLISPGQTNETEDSSLALVESIKGFMQTAIGKIDSDIYTTATAFADAQNIQRSLGWADWFGYILDKVTTALKLTSAVLALEDPSQALSEIFSEYELPLQLFSGLLSVDSSIQTRNKLRLSIEGPAYLSNVKKMLEEAYEESSTKLFFNYLAYQTVIKNHLLGLNGSSPLAISHRSLSETRENIEAVGGGARVQEDIRDKFRELMEDVENMQISSQQEKEIIGQIEKARKALLRSKLHGTNLKYKTHHGDSIEVWLGNIGEFEKARLDALTNLDKRLEREEVLTVTKAYSGALNAWKIYLIPINPALGKAVGAINQILMLPSGIDLSERLMKTSVHKTNPREQINMIPQEMLLALSKEISDVWMVADDMAEYIETQLINKPSGQDTYDTICANLLRSWEGVQSAWRDIEKVLKRRYENIPVLVELIKRYSAPEEWIFTEIEKVYLAYQLAQTPKDKILAMIRVEKTFSKIMTFTENFPYLRANEVFMRLQYYLAGTQSRILVEREKYNKLLNAFLLMIRSDEAKGIAKYCNINYEQYEKYPDVKY